MPAASVYYRVRQVLKDHISLKVDASSLDRLSLLVVGMIQAKHAAPARIADALYELGLSEAKPPSIERRIRRTENDPELRVQWCLAPLVQRQLAAAAPPRLLLILDATQQDDRVVMLLASVWYRGRALPVAWRLWPANQPLHGPGFWQRVEEVLEDVKAVVPAGSAVIWLADRAFGTPNFTDLVRGRGWQVVVRVQDQTQWRDGFQAGSVRALVQQPGQRRKLRGQVFKKHGWREMSVVVHWGLGHQHPLCLVTSLPPSWDILHLYRRRYPIEALFRHYKAKGWQWELGQVTHLPHLQRLLVAMALATWVCLLAGAVVADEVLAQPPTGCRRTPPPEAKLSLFSLGLRAVRHALASPQVLTLAPLLTDWTAPTWEQQVTWHHTRAFVFLARFLPCADC